MDRRAFLQTSAGVAAGISLTGATGATLQADPPKPIVPPAAPNSVTASTVVLYNDAAPVSPAEQVQRLAQLVSTVSDPTDQYLKGGAVGDLETRAATMFGKPAAAFFPTGTMANNVAIRLLWATSA